MKVKQIDSKVVNVKLSTSEDNHEREFTTYRCGDYKIVTDRRVGDEPIWTFYTITGVEGCNSYLPRIYHYTDLTGETMGFFEIQTTSYGALRGYEYAELLKAMTHAGKVADALTDYFIKGVR